MNSIQTQLLMMVSLLLILLFAYAIKVQLLDDGNTKIDGQVVATIADKKILVADLVDRLELRSGGVQQQIPGEKQKQLVLNEMIQREVQLIAARRAGYDSDPKVIAALENLVIARLRDNQLEKILDKVVVSEAEVAAYYQYNLEKYTTPAMTRFAMIKLALSPQASLQKSAELKVRAEQAYGLAQTLPDTVKGFGSLAAKYSDHQASRYIGGDRGWLVDGKQGLYDPTIVAALTALTPDDQLAPLVKTDEGYYLIRLIDQKPANQQRLDVVSSHIARMLEKQKRQRAESDWLLSLQELAAPLVVNQQALVAVQIPAAAHFHTRHQSPPSLP